MTKKYNLDDETLRHFKDKNIEFAVWGQVLKLEEQGPSDNMERSLEAVRQVNNLNRRDAKKVLSLAEKLFEQSELLDIRKHSFVQQDLTDYLADV